MARVLCGQGNRRAADHESDGELFLGSSESFAAIVPLIVHIGMFKSAARLSSSRRQTWLCVGLVLGLTTIFLMRAAPALASPQFPCPTTGNPIPCENALPGDTQTD